MQGKRQRLRDQRQAGEQQQYQHGLPERLVVDFAEEFESGPETGNHERYAQGIQRQRIPGDRAGDGLGYRYDDERHEQHRLKYRPLHILWPTAPLARDRRDDAAKSREPAEQAVGYTDRDVGSGSNPHRSEHGPRQAVDRVKHEQHTDAEPQVCRVEVSQDADADGYTDDRSQRERPGFLQVEGMAQLEYAIALREQAVAGDQSGGLHRRDDVQPYAGYDEAHGEAGKTTDETAGKGGKSKESKDESIHGFAPRTRWRALGWGSI